MDQSTRPSLDDLLNEIKHESSNFPEISSAGGTGAPRSTSAGMANISAHLTPVTTPAPDERADSTEVWEPQMSSRQLALPKLDLKMIGGMVAVILLTLGIGSTTYLAQQSQDLRQQAYEETLPAIEGAPVSVTEEQQNTLERLTEQQEVVSQRITVLGAVILGIAAFALIGFFAWLFFA